MAHAEKRGKFWRVRYKLPNGRYASASCDDFGNKFPTERLAEQYGLALEADVRRGKFHNPRGGQLSFAEYSVEWLEAIDVAETTDRTYRSLIASQLVPEWGNVNLADISALGFRAWKKRLGRAHEKNYVDNIVSLFRTMLEDAVTEKLITENPVPTGRRLRRGRYVPPPQVEDEYVHGSPLQLLNVASNASVIRGLTGYTMVLTIAYAGLRIGEIAGLERKYVWLSDDPYGSYIRVEHQGQWLGGGKGFTQLPPKYASYRTLILPPFLAGLLREQLASHDNRWVFPSITGKPLRADDEFYGRFWTPIVAGRPAEPRRKGTRGKPGLPAVEGVEEMVPHGGRHSMKVWLDEDGHPAVAVEARMGHKLPGVEGTYSHVTKLMECRIAVSLQARWEASQGVAQTLWGSGSPINLPEAVKAALAAAA
ncbi:tyrosine-type recombinase/integrase [Kitasatospora sp. MBT66]|uniref:tyrosine-type recombinase/integrase n=1 Tax=Kitasatospora sp. MBT66 TaxID=1444769 RepID=UPI0011EA6D25|nr:tyrosine-type recombinase/integrase [Kitasatospora sp. MBT66]